MSFWQRLLNAFRVFWSILTRGRIPADLVPVAPAPLVAPVAPRAAAPRTKATARCNCSRCCNATAGSSTSCRRTSAPYADAQIGAAVRDVHDKCRATLERYVTLEPVLEDEGEPIRVARSTEPARESRGRCRRTESASGVVRHRGWRVTRRRAAPAPGVGRAAIVGAAEVEVIVR